MRLRLNIWPFLTLAWAGYIFSMSTEGYGAAQSRSVFAQLLALLNIHLSLTLFEFVHTLVRKLAHSAEYAVLSVLVYRTLSGRSRLEWQVAVARWSLLVCLLFSLLDEFHQLFVRGRGPSVVDSGIDFSGAVLGICLIYFDTRSRASALSHL